MKNVTVKVKVKCEESKDKKIIVAWVKTKKCFNEYFFKL